MRRREVVDDLPAVGASGLGRGIAPERLAPQHAGILADHPALDGDRGLGADGPHRVVGDRIGGQRRLVDVDLVREVEQVVDRQHVMTADLRRTADGLLPGRRPGRIGIPAIVRNRRLVREGGIARPDPDEAVPLDRRIGPDRRSRRDRRLAGNRDAGAGGVEFEPVIAAADAVAEIDAERERQVAVAAPVGERRGRSVRSPEQHDRFLADRPRRQLLAEIARERRDIPGVKQEHVSSFLRGPPILSLQARRAQPCWHIVALNTGGRVPRYGAGAPTRDEGDFRPPTTSPSS